MDTNTTNKEDSIVLARELLIAISDSVPDKILKSRSAYKNSNLYNGTAVIDEDRVDKLRSELISISDLPSPDKIALPEVSTQEG